ncbi:MAG: helix-turn-helix transcriptional regulator, partial [Ruminococcus sp.]|nr:helix-turn-helix transcriptional regulator [Ruminococcus sp.]
MDMKMIGSRLKRLRQEKGLTQEQLAEKLYVSVRTVSRWE